MPNGKRPASLRVVLDTNVLISALQFPDGALSGIWPPLQIDEYVLLLSPAIVTELASKLRDKFYWEEPLLRDSLRTLVRKAEIIQPHTLPDAIPEDPADPEQAWSGRGAHPKWLRALLEQGRSIEEFRV